MTPLHYRSLVEVADELAGGRLSAESLVGHLLQRIEGLDGELCSYVRVFEEEALQRARQLDRELAAGQPPGPLHGVPLAIKDLLAVAGHPTTVGGRVHERWQPTEEATVVRRLKAAGAVILGKLKLTEGAFAEHHPDIVAPRNPWDAAAWTGVSSSGSGVATAAGLCFGSLGTDTGGSIRFPAAACGVVGVKPTYGLVSRHGAFALAESLDHVGPMARSVRDAARLLTVLAGHDPHDLSSLEGPVPDYEAALQPGLAGIRLGVDPLWSSSGVEPEVSRSVADAAGILAGAGAELREIRMPDARVLIEGWAVTCGVEAALAHQATFPSRRSEYGPVLAALLDKGRRSLALDYVALEHERQRYRAALQEVFASVDAVILPAMPFPPPPLAQLDAQDGAEPITFTAPFDYSGSPSVTVPAGFTSEGLPLAFQVVGPHCSEARLLRIAHQYELEGGRGPRHPPAHP